MRRRGVNLAEAAEFLGIDMTVLSRMLNGHRVPGRERAIAIEDLTGVSVRSWSVDSSSQQDGTENSAAAIGRKSL